jgi:hypothetical protein
MICGVGPIFLDGEVATFNAADDSQFGTLVVEGKGGIHSVPIAVRQCVIHRFQDRVPTVGLDLSMHFNARAPTRTDSTESHQSSVVACLRSVSPNVTSVQLVERF